MNNGNFQPHYACFELLEPDVWYTVERIADNHWDIINADRTHDPHTHDEEWGTFVHHSSQRQDFMPPADNLYTCSKCGVSFYRYSDYQAHFCGPCSILSKLTS